MSYTYLSIRSVILSPYYYYHFHINWCTILVDITPRDVEQSEVKEKRILQ